MNNNARKVKGHTLCHKVKNFNTLYKDKQGYPIKIKLE